MTIGWIGGACVRNSVEFAITILHKCKIKTTFYNHVKLFSYSVCVCVWLKGAWVRIVWNSRWYLYARKSPHALHPVSRVSQTAHSNSSNVRLIDYGPLSSFQGRSSSASSSHASIILSLLQSKNTCKMVPTFQLQLINNKKFFCFF